MSALISDIISLWLLFHSLNQYRQDKYFRALYLLVLSYALPEIVNGIAYDIRSFLRPGTFPY